MEQDDFIFYEGKIYARVSAVTSKKGQFSHIPKHIVDNKCRIGSEVHEAIEADIEDSLPILSQDCMGYYKSYLAWKEEVQPHFIISEERFFCDKFMLTGKIDVIAKIGSENIVIDFKTSAKESSSWVLQGHLYHYLLTEAQYNISQRMMFVKLEKTGKKASIFEYFYDKNTFNTCVNLIKEFWSKEDKNK